MKAEEGEVVDFALPLQTIPAATIPEEYLQPLDLGYDQEESVDQRAERFFSKLKDKGFEEGWTYSLQNRVHWAYRGKSIARKN
ncbi:hypothetical protein GH714_019162 [Hevea brasiliensis]|uniref:Uncharacterized protein n=1 Tax=Hevea brasiliensis TaxID=3981 RepID=A0A6A6ND43_HEVBR|nr:hypothetical protein GH714_019162 [Hevea brasiliensis]